MNTNKHALLTIFLIIFIDLLGFGLIIPIVPFYLEKFISRPDEIGRTIAAMITIFSLMQFIFSPIWGRLSDRYGRRPILLISLTGAMISHVLFAVATNLTFLFAARILTGIFSATVPTAMAYIADVTDQENRAKGMGLVGAAFGLGFILGPATGGILSGVRSSDFVRYSSGLCIFQPQRNRGRRQSGGTGLSSFQHWQPAAFVTTSEPRPAVSHFFYRHHGLCQPGNRVCAVY